MAAILIVDDCADMRHVLRARLEANGYEVAEAEDGADALAALVLKKRPDMIVCDLLMPAMDGHEFCRRARRIGFDGPLLFLSGVTEPEEKQAALDEGGDDYLAKPFDPKEFEARVRALLRRRPPAPAI